MTVVPMIEGTSVGLIANVATSIVKKKTEGPDLARGNSTAA